MKFWEQTKQHLELVPRAGLEPARINRAILSRLRLPVPPSRLTRELAICHGL